MSDLVTRIVTAVTRPSYTAIKPKVLAKRLGIADDDYPEFRRTLRELIREGRLTVGRNNTIQAADPHGTVVGTYRRGKSGNGYVRPTPVDGNVKPDIFIREDKSGDASTGDVVLVRITREASGSRDAAGEIVDVRERATRTFVGTYFVRETEAYVRVDGTLFAHSILVGDPGAKGAKPNDKVVIEMLRFPTPESRGEGVIAEVLGKQGEPGVDTLSIIKAFGLPEAFPEAVLTEARAQADAFNENDLDGRTDFTNDLVITIDPVDARDFDDAVSVTIDPKTKHWILTVHIADVGHFAKPGSALDTEARKRATSVYLPQRVIPMFPEVISNGLASLQEGRLRYVKTVQMEFTPSLQKGKVTLYNGAIKVRKRFAYEQVSEILNNLSSTKNLASGGRQSPEAGESKPLDGVTRTNEVESVRTPQPRGADAPPAPGDSVDPDVLAALKRMRDLGMLLRKKRFRRGSLELSMPEAVLEYDTDGRVSGAHFAVHDVSHQIIEEFMLAANEAVAEHFASLEVPFLRRVHPAPKEEKLEAFAQFADLMGFPLKRSQDRFELQRVLDASAAKPERAAVHYALLRSLKQATYSPIQDQHYALASTHYCHFTSPIRRYPDLTVHRLLDRWLKHGKPAADLAELTVLGDHCSKMERRAETAERELVKLKLLLYLSDKLGTQFDAVITGVADYGFFAQAEVMPVEGLVHISSLTDDYYEHDESEHTLYGRRNKTRYRLGDRVRVEVSRVEVQRRMLDFRLVRDLPRPRVEKPRRDEEREEKPPLKKKPGKEYLKKKKKRR
jgi:ribonuclease R